MRFSHLVIFSLLCLHLPKSDRIAKSVIALSLLGGDMRRDSLVSKFGFQAIFLEIDPRRRLSW